MQDNQIKNDNLLALQKALEQELLNEVVTKLDLYEIKINEVFSNISELQDIMLLQIDENKKASNNLTQIEIDAKISKALEEFEISKPSQKNESSSFMIYFLIAVVFLCAAYNGVFEQCFQKYLNTFCKNIF